MNANKNFHDFLTTHFQETVESHDSAIGILYDYYAESREATDPEIQATLKTLRQQLATEDTDTIIGTVLNLCTLHEEIGFRGGLNMGIALAKELLSLG